MKPEDHARLRALFDAAMALPPGDRPAFVDAEVAVGDPLRVELVAMIEIGDDSRFIAEDLGTGLTAGDARGGDLPSQFVNYRVLRELGRGGMGVVYLALRNDDAFHKVVALKVMGAGVAPPDAGFQRFKQERQILAGLDHPNIARLLDGGNTEDGRPFYVMEYVAGASIDEYCRRIGADVPSRVRMVLQVCDALEYLHSHAIAHRDIKPNNILVTPDGRVRLLDFGIAKVDTVEGLVASPSAPGQPTMIMTPGYASPEQLGGHSAGKSSDLYSLGVVLYELLTGHLPYTDGDGRADLAAQLSGADPAPPSKDLAAGAKPATRSADSRTSHPDLDRVVLTALQRDPSRRYVSVQMFAEDLRRCLDGRPIVARPESATYVFRKLVGRNKVAAALAALLVVTAGTGAWMAVEIRIERAQLEGKEVELERIVSLLHVKLVRWVDPQQSMPVAEKVADVQAATRLVASGTLRTLALRVADPSRLARLLEQLGRFLDRAETLSSGEVPVQKEIALAYREVGDFQSAVERADLGGKTQATQSYRRSASLASSVRDNDPVWSERQLSELGERLNKLGTALDLSPQPSAEPPPRQASLPAPSRVPASIPVRHQTATEAPREAVDPEMKAELTARLKKAVLNAERARQNLEALRARLIRTGQTPRSDLAATMAEIESVVSDAGKALTTGDLTQAEGELRHAEVQLRQLFQAVGG